MGVTPPMANLHGYGSDAVGNLVNHYTRHNGDPDQTKYRYANQNIHPESTEDNYALFERPDPAGYVRELMGRATVKPRVGGKKETNVLSDWVVTLPKNPALVGREREFFEQAYAFLCERVPEEMRLGAWVHMDENQPHMHFAFSPLLRTPAMTNDKSRPLLWTKKDEKRNPKHKAGTPKLDTKGTPRYERVQKTDERGNPVWNLSFGQSKVFTREKMQAFHEDLERAMERHFGFVVGIQLEDPGEKQLSKLEQKDYIAARRTLERQQSQIAENSERLEGLRRAEEAETEAIADLDRAIQQKELESAPETLGESVRALFKARSDGSREEVLGSEVERLRGRIGELEVANQRARERVAELDRGLPRLRERVRELEGAGARLARRVEYLRGGVSRARERFERLASRVSGCVEHVGERVASLLRSLGVEAYGGARDGGGYSLGSELRDMRAANRQLGRESASRGWDSRGARGAR